MKRLLIALALIVAVQALPVAAQDSPSLSNLEISVWPEFDRPGMLVIYRGIFEAETPLPVPVEIRIPARIGRPTALAYESGGELFVQDSEARQDGDWVVVSFELPTLAFQLEYYDDQLTVESSGGRQFSYSFQPDYPVAAMIFEAQVPPDAEAFALDPAADLIDTGDFGLDYHIVEVGEVAPGTELSWTLSYQRDSTVLTQDILSPQGLDGNQSSGMTQVPQGSEDNSSTVLIFLIGFIAVIAVGAVAFWLGQRSQPPPEPIAPRRPKRRGSGRGLSSLGPRSPASNEGESVFCFQCGAELRPGSEFCHICGSEARR